MGRPRKNTGESPDFSPAEPQRTTGILTGDPLETLLNMLSEGEPGAYSVRVFRLQAGQNPITCGPPIEDAAFDVSIVGDLYGDGDYRLQLLDNHNRRCIVTSAPLSVRGVGARGPGGTAAPAAHTHAAALPPELSARLDRLERENADLRKPAASDPTDVFTRMLSAVTPLLAPLSQRTDNSMDLLKLLLPLAFQKQQPIAEVMQALRAMDEMRGVPATSGGESEAGWGDQAARMMEALPALAQGLKSLGWSAPAATPGPAAPPAPNTPQLPRPHTEIPPSRAAAAAPTVPPSGEQTARESPSAESAAQPQQGASPPADNPHAQAWALLGALLQTGAGVYAAAESDDDRTGVASMYAQVVVDALEAGGVEWGNLLIDHEQTPKLLIATFPALEPHHAFLVAVIKELPAEGDEEEDAPAVAGTIGGVA